VTFTFVGEPDKGPAVLGQEYGGRALTIEPGQWIRIPVMFHSNLRQLQEIRLDWEDDSGRRHKVMEVSTIV
jgi:hypothetical protein